MADEELKIKSGPLNPFKKGTGAHRVTQRQKFHLTIPGTSIREARTASKKHFAEFGRRQERFRATRGLFTTGLNLSRLRALSSIR